MPVQVTPRRRSNWSPLRYPGGKASLAPFFEKVIGSLGLDKPTYVEPFAGGAGAGLDLLYNGVVGRVVINDLDHSVHACWYAMLNHSEEFLRRVREVPLTVDEWRRQREIYKRRHTDPSIDRVELGFATFYLNRTNRSGVLRAGVIGGLDQSGQDKIDARFNREALTDRIEKLARNRNKILLTRQDGASRLAHWLPKRDVFAYVDPPYVAKGGSLYWSSFNSEQHQALARMLIQHRSTNWVLTYDLAKPIKALYEGCSQVQFSLAYSAHRREQAQELMVFSDSVSKALNSR